MNESTEHSSAYVERQPRIFLNGFPKSGLHLAVLMARTLTPNPAAATPWAGSFGWNAWSAEWLPIENIMGNIRLLHDDAFLKGHMGYHPTVEQYLYWHGSATCFIYRDLRDVLVSQSHHVVAEDDGKFFHPEKELYRPMSHEDRLLACLCGVQQFSGLFERWELYAPWLNVPWVMKIRYEDMTQRPEVVAAEFLDYVWGRTAWGYTDAEWVGVDPAQRDSYVDLLVDNMTRTEYSPTFRKGGSGGWREEFTTRVKDEFKKRAGDWLIKLGYEDDNDW